MPRLRVRVELNRGGVGVPLHKLASVVHEAQRFFEMLAEDVHIAQDRGEWLGFDFDNESLNFTAEFVGPVSADQAQAFYAAFDGTTSLRRATIGQFTQITEAIGEDELIGFGLYHSDQEADPSEWRCLSRRDALRIADEIQLLLGVAGEMRQETHLPAIVDSGVGARLFKDRPHRGGPLPDKLPDLVREVESTLSKRITRIEENMEGNSQAIRDLRESSAATEESFKGLLNAVENFCGQATKQLERLSPPAELAAVPEAVVPAAVVPEVVPAAGRPSATVPAAGRPAAAVPARAIPAAAIAEPEPEPAIPAASGSSWRTFLVAAAVVIVAAGGLFWWLGRPADPGAQTVVGGTPSSVIASTQPVPSNPSLESAKATAQSNVDKPSPMPQPQQGETKATPARKKQTVAAKDTSSSAVEPLGGTAAAAAEDAMHLEIEAQEPVWVMVTDKDGKILIARTLQTNEARTLEVGDNATLRTGNAGGLRVKLNGKDLGHLGPTGKIRDIHFRAGEFKVAVPDNS